MTKVQVAFTLIELLVVIAIIGILSGLIVITMNTATGAAKDGVRKADINNLKKVLIAYKALNGKYPIQLTQCNIGDTTASGCLTLASSLFPDYLGTFPKDPLGTYYGYQSNSGTSFTLFSTLADGDYYTYSSSSGFVNGTCGDPVTFTYNGSEVTHGTVVSQAGKCWMDRNLGATQVATSYADAAAYGDLFQWGRVADGHQLRTSLNTSVLSDTDTPIDSSFIMITVSPYNWRSTVNNTLWVGVSGINNPCPSGWRLPTNSEWAAEITAGGWNGRVSAFSSPLKLTVAGIRNYNVGTFTNVGVTGYYWNSSVTGNNSYYFYTTSTASTYTSSYRAYGMSVRCIKN